MIIKQKIMRNVSLTAHPLGCAQDVQNQIAYVEQHPSPSASLYPKRVLIVGGSTGYGLAARIVAAIGAGSATINVSVEREPSENKVATAGWYNTEAFEKEATKRGLFARSLYADAFSDQTKEATADLIATHLGQVDLIIYSVASPLRTDPDTKEVYHSVIKPIGKTYSALSLDMQSGLIEQATIEPAQEDQVEQTIKVMGGEDWQRWVEFLAKRNLLAENFITVAFSYIGPQMTHPMYRDGTIGKAKEHLEASAKKITALLQTIGGRALVSVNKAVVTRASAVIPVVPLYIALLYKVMKEQALHEECIEQMSRLFDQRLYGKKEIPLDKEGRIRLDDWEMKPQVQLEVQRRWKLQQEGKPLAEGDLDGFRRQYDHIHGFGFESIDYEKDVDPTRI